MEITSQKYHFHCLQEFLIKIHRELTRITKTQCMLADIKLDIENDYIEKLLVYLVTELKRYGMYSKFEKMSYKYRRKELLLLLTKQLGVKIHQNEAGDMAGHRNTFDFSSTLHNCTNNGDFKYKFNENSLAPCVRNSDLNSLYEVRKPNNVYVQYQLYSKILDEIQQELSGFSSLDRDPVVNVLLTGLCVRLQQQGEFAQLDHVPLDQKRRQLLRLLATQLMEKCNQITMLDKIRDTTKEVNDILYRKYGSLNCCPNKIWEKIINLGPKQDLMVHLYNNYPVFITEKFLEYLLEEKENIILDQENIFSAKIALFKKEALETTENLKKYLQYKNYVESFLNDYTQQLQVHYDITEKEFYRQQILKSKIKDINTKIKKNKILACLNLKEINKKIQKQEKNVQNLHYMFNNVMNRVP